MAGTKTAVAGEGGTKTASGSGGGGFSMTGPGWANLDAAFKSKLLALMGAVAARGGRLYINSGWRSPQRQAELYADAVKKYGAARAGHFVAAPGKSHHNAGWAADLGGNLQLAHELAEQFGLKFPMPWEPWHIEPSSAPDDPEAQTTPPNQRESDAVPAVDPHDPVSQAKALEQILNGAVAGVENLDFSPDQVQGSATGGAPAVTKAGTGVSAIVAAARAAGFKGQALVEAVAIALAEGSAPGARYTNKDGSVDRGYWQFNSKWHPEVSDAEADDPTLAAQHAFRVSSGGTNFKAWSTYKNGKYKEFLPQAQAAIGGTG